MARTSTAGICEDDDELREVCAAHCKRADFYVRATASGTEAVRVFSADP